MYVPACHHARQTALQPLPHRTPRCRYQNAEAGKVSENPGSDEKGACHDEHQPVYEVICGKTVLFQFPLNPKPHVSPLLTGQQRSATSGEDHYQYGRKRAYYGSKFNKDEEFNERQEREQEKEPSNHTLWYHPFMTAVNGPVCSGQKKPLRKGGKNLRGQIKIKKSLTRKTTRLDKAVCRESNAFLFMNENLWKAVRLHKNAVIFLYVHNVPIEAILVKKFRAFFIGEFANFSKKVALQLQTGCSFGSVPQSPGSS